MATGLVTWSKTASSNATADASVNWAEGQAPSSVNDSARAMMASVAMFRDDTNGSIATGGTSTAYTVTSNQSFASLSAMDNAVIAFTPHTTSGSAPTLAVDGLTAKKIRMTTGVDMPDGVLVSGTPYVVTYDAGVGEFLLHNFAGNPWLVPLGVALPFFGTSAPNAAFVLPYGQAISRATYSTLFSMFSTTFGSGDGSSTFNIPDLRGVVIAGKDNMGGSTRGVLTASGGLIGTSLGNSLTTSETITLTSAQMPSHTHTANVTDPGHSHPFTTHSGLATAQGGVGVSAIETGETSGSTGSNTTGITVSNTNTGGGGAHSNIQPTIIGNYLMRII